MAKATNRVTTLAGCVAVFVFALGCTSASGVNVEYFVVRVDSVEVPTAVQAGVEVTVRVLGVIGPSGCYRLSEIRVEPTKRGVALTVIGEVPVDPASSCTGMVVTLDETVRLDPPSQFPFTVEVVQPEGAPFTRVVALIS